VLSLATAPFLSQADRKGEALAVQIAGIAANQAHWHRITAKLNAE
jgi:hypothetical protein